MTSTAIFALTIAFVFFKQFALVIVQLVGRLRTGMFRYEEDKKKPDSKVGDPPLTGRGQAVIRNALENEPIFLFLLGAYLFLNPDDAGRAQGAMIYASVFIAARTVHMIVFLMRISIVRTLSYGVGLLATLGLAVQVVLDAL